jgi:predicted lactoylglutathione lyase
MKSKLIWANFSVKDAKRTNEFYAQLGFTPNRPHSATLNLPVSFLAKIDL